MGMKQAADDITFMNALFSTAEAQAHLLGDEVPGAEHLMLAALAMDDESGRDALRFAGSDAGAFREAIVSSHAEALNAVGVSAPNPAPIAGKNRGAFRSSPTAHEVFHRAVAISKARQPRQLRTADVVRATAELERGTAARAITALGVDRTALVAAATTAAANAAA